MRVNLQFRFEENFVKTEQTSESEISATGKTVWQQRTTLTRKVMTTNYFVAIFVNVDITASLDHQFV